MKSQYQYPIVTGELDRERLIILNKLYNPNATHFLVQNGLKAGMKVLELGCRQGQMSNVLAQKIGPEGKVFAIDPSAEQLTIAKKNANEAGLNNIEFVQMGLEDLSSLKEKFDFIYGRAAIEYFIGDREKSLHDLFYLLNSSGIFAYESVSAIQDGHFCYPYQSFVDHYFATNKNYFIKSQVSSDFFSELFPWVKQHLKEIKVQVNQPILFNDEDKSILRLNAISARNTVFSRYSDLEFEKLLQQLKNIEQNDEIILGFFRSMLIKGVKYTQSG